MITGKKIKLRALEPKDLDFLYEIENNTSFWEYGTTQTPLSRFVLKKYLDNALRDIYEVKQLRLVITNLEDVMLGLIDLYDFDPKNKRVGVAIIIAEEKNRGKGFALEAINLLCDYAFSQLAVHQVYANIGEDNTKSMALFEKAGFKKSGLKKDWNFYAGAFKDEVLFQKFNK
ncbi:MAG: GNAT family N-acetyltransferase [Flavobacteriaceae bacterium]